MSLQVQYLFGDFASTNSLRDWLNSSIAAGQSIKRSALDGYAFQGVAAIPAPATMTGSVLGLAILVLDGWVVGYAAFIGAHEAKTVGHRLALSIGHQLILGQYQRRYGCGTALTNDIRDKANAGGYYRIVISSVEDADGYWTKKGYKAPKQGGEAYSSAFGGYSHKLTLRHPQ